MSLVITSHKAQAQALFGAIILERTLQDLIQWKWMTTMAITPTAMTQCISVPTACQIPCTLCVQSRPNITNVRSPLEQRRRRNLSWLIMPSVCLLQMRLPLTVLSARTAITLRETGQTSPLLARSCTGNSAYQMQTPTGNSKDWLGTYVHAQAGIQAQLAA